MQHHTIDTSTTIEEYDSLYAQYLSSKTLRLNTMLLEINPDAYTLWNDRRALYDIEPTKELKWLKSVIPVQPKSYWTWNHRLFVIKQAQLDTLWDAEMALITAFLHKDERNFHVWDYRKRILNARYGDYWSNQSCLEAELAFTTTMIQRSFSNYSAWHWRSKVLSALHYMSDITQILVKDLEMLLHCFYADPMDQSGWFYFHWVMQHDIPRKYCEDTWDALIELEEMEPQCIWIKRGLFSLSPKAGKPFDKTELLSMDKRHALYTHGLVNSDV